MVALKNVGESNNMWLTAKQLIGALKQLRQKHDERTLRRLLDAGLIDAIRVNNTTIYKVEVKNVCGLRLGR